MNSAVLFLIDGPDFDCVNVTVWPARYCWKAAARAAAPRPVTLPGCRPTLLRFEDARVRMMSHFREDPEVATTEGLCRHPVFTVLVGGGEDDGAACAAFGGVRLIFKFPPSFFLDLIVFSQNRSAY